jgi:hypothetical protein
MRQMTYPSVLVLTTLLLSTQALAEEPRWGRFQPLVKDGESLLDDIQSDEFDNPIGLKLRPGIAASLVVPGDQTASEGGLGLSLTGLYRHEIPLTEVPPDLLVCPESNVMPTVRCRELMTQAFLRYDDGIIVTLLLGIEAVGSFRLASLPYEDQAGTTVAGAFVGTDERGVHAGRSFQGGAMARLGLGFIPWRYSMSGIQWETVDGKRYLDVQVLGTRTSNNMTHRYAVELLAGVTYTNASIQAVDEASGGVATSDVIKRRFLQPTLGASVGFSGVTGLAVDVQKVFLEGGGWLVRGRINILNVGLFMDIKLLEGLSTPEDPVMKKWGSSRYNEIMFGLDFQFNLI